MTCWQSWSKPLLHRYSLNGSTANNVIGELYDTAVGAAFVDPKAPEPRERIFSYNATTDVVRLRPTYAPIISPLPTAPSASQVRLLMNIQQSLIRAFTGKKNEAPTGAVRTSTTSDARRHVASRHGFNH